MPTSSETTAVTSLLTSLLSISSPSRWQQQLLPDFDMTKSKLIGKEIVRPIRIAFQWKLTRWTNKISDLISGIQLLCKVLMDQVSGWKQWYSTENFFVTSVQCDETTNGSESIPKLRTLFVPFCSTSALFSCRHTLHVCYIPLRFCCYAFSFFPR